MFHKDAIKLLFPLELGGVFDDDVALEGAQLDDAQVSADQLLKEMFPDTCTYTITDWERTYGVTPSANDPLQVRQNRVLAKLRARGGLSLQYFLNVAQTMGYTITIEKLMANTDNYGLEGRFRWRVTTSGIGPVYFRAGRSRVADRLVTGNVMNTLEGIFNDLKPAYTQVIFAYI